MKTMLPGAELTVLADDPAAIVDIPHYVQEAGHSLLRQDLGGPHQVYVIAKS